MASEPVRSTAVEAAPKDYSIPNAQQIRLLSVLADFDGSGSAADYLPALQILDNNGNVLVTAADPAVSVAAGGSATVSWFPGVKVAAAAASGTGAAWFFAKRETPQTITTTAPRVRVAFTHIVTSDSSVFTTTTDGAGRVTVIGNKLGIYLAVAQAGWHPNATYPNSVNVVTDFFGVSVAANSPLSASVSAADPVGEITNVHDAMLAVTQAVPGEISMVVQNWDGVNHSLDSAYYMVAYWPNATPAS